MSGTFVYSNPRTISWGVDSLAGLPAEIARHGASRVVIVTTAPVADNRALMTMVNASLAATPPLALCLVGQHAPVADVQRALEAREAHGAELIISLGGGSPIDAAKVVARGRIGDGVSRPVLPHVAIPTTLSAAELSWRAGFTDEAGDKSGFADEAMLPSAVFYDPRLAALTPIWLWLSTGVRALDHAVECILAAGDHPFSDVLAFDAIVRLFSALPRAMDDPSDVQARGDGQLGAWFSYTLPGPTMTGLSHKMGKQIGARHRIPHGVTSCLVLPHVMRYLASRGDPGMTRIEAELNIRFGGTRPAASRVQDFIGSLRLPQHIADYGVGAKELRQAADEIGGGYPADDLYDIYLAAL